MRSSQQFKADKIRSDLSWSIESSEIWIQTYSTISLQSDMSLNELVNSFKFERVLASNPQTKTIALLGTIDDKPGIITVEKSHFSFDETNLDGVLPIRTCVSDFAFINGIEKVKTTAYNDNYYWGL